MEYTNEHIKTSHAVIRKVYEETVIPLTIFINPELKGLDYTPVTCYEACESVRGYSAAVSRPYEVEVTALNASAEKFTWRSRGWSARIAQHEYDHLQVRFRRTEKLHTRTHITENSMRHIFQYTDYDIFFIALAKI